MSNERPILGQPVLPLPGADGHFRFVRLKKGAPDSDQRFIRPVLPLPGADGHFRFVRLKKRAATLIELVQRARVMMGNLHGRCLKLGRIFCRIKREVREDGGRWKKFYYEHFNTSIVSYRTGCRYMQRWRRARAREKGDRLSPLKPGTSRNSREIDVTTAEVQREVRADYAGAPKAEPDYRLSIRRLGAVRRAAVIRLWKSKHRDPVEKNVVTVLDEGLTKYEFATKNELKAEEVAR